MCIIAIKQRGVEFPSISRLENMCDNNPHGFAVVWQDNAAENKNVKVFRTMNRGNFVQKYKWIVRNHDAESTALFLHARIATHGSLRIENCHGFVDYEQHVYFAHNGVLQIPNRGDLTDSETFFRDIFIPALQHGGWKEAEGVIEEHLGSSKFVFMTKGGELRKYGNFTSDYNGVLYSNLSYKNRNRIWLTTNR